MLKVKTVQNFDHEATHDLFKRSGFVLKFDVAPKLGIQYQTLIHILQGRRKPMPEIVQRMADLLHVSYNDLLKGAK